MPSPSSSIELGRADGVDADERASRSGGSEAKWRAREGLHALHERLLGARRDEQHAQARRPAARAGSRASPSSAATPVRLSLAPGTVEREPISAIVAAVPSDTRPPAPRAGARDAGQPAERDEQRAADHRATSAAGSCPCARAARGSASAEPAARRGVRRAAPVCAASWWATTTRCASASRSPASATTFQVGRGGQQRGAGTTARPPVMSSAIAAAASAPATASAPAPAGERRERRPRR